MTKRRTLKKRQTHKKKKIYGGAGTNTEQIIKPKNHSSYFENVIQASRPPSSPNSNNEKRNNQLSEVEKSAKNEYNKTVQKMKQRESWKSGTLNQKMRIIQMIRNGAVRKAPRLNSILPKANSQVD
jgi:hypothetical protein